MATIQQIIDYAKLMYPRVEDITEANQIIILNQIQDEIKNKLLRVKWENEPVTSTTIADQKTYTLPTGCKPYNIIRLLVAEDTTGVDWNEYIYIGVNDNRNIDCGYYYSFIGEDTAIIIKDGEPIPASGLEIRWFFYKEPTALSTATQTPDVETEYHNLFKYALIQNVACIGDNPETSVADYWQNKFNEELQVALNNLSDKFDSAPLKTRQSEEIW